MWHLRGATTVAKRENPAAEPRLSRRRRSYRKSMSFSLLWHSGRRVAWPLLG